MKIMYVNTLGVWGGVATYLKPLIAEQVKNNNEVYLVVGNEGSLTEYIRKEYPAVHVIILSSMERDVNPIGIVKSIFKFRGILRSIKPDLIHINCIMAGLICRIGSVFNKAKIVYNAHGWAFEPGTSKKYKWPAIIIEKFLALFTDSIICVSDYEKKIADKYHIFKNNKQAVVIKNASVDFGYVGVQNDSDTFVITMAARFWKQKNQLLLIKSIEYLMDSYTLPKKVRLFLLGDGPLLEECKSYVNDKGLSEVVTFTGRVSNVRDYYYKSDLVALITNYDAIAISLIEALSMGKPLLASKVSGVPENFSSEKNGYCVENNVSEISNAIYELMKDSQKPVSMAVNSRKLFESDFQLEMNIKKHNMLYSKLIK